ncbi:MAG: nucleotidyltransferase domain-containing protein [Candidatus Nanoarchaeia archaeon]
MDREQLLKEIENFKKKLPFDSRIIVFGSRIKNTNRKDSDVDLIVISEYFRDIKFNKRMPIMYDYWDMNYPVDFICYTPEEFEEKTKEVTIAKTAQQEGVVV